MERIGKTRETPKRSKGTPRGLDFGSEESPGPQGPKAPRTHILRLLGPKTLLEKGFWAVLSRRGRHQDPWG